MATSIVRVLPASELAHLADMWVTDPPYADAIHYHEITEYFIAWLVEVTAATRLDLG